jgi:hypothetical protein
LKQISEIRAIRHQASASTNSLNWQELAAWVGHAY